MLEAKFILSKKKLLEQVKILEELGLKISYSYKTNRIVGEVLQKISDVDFSIHAKEEIKDIEDKNKIWFFTQAESEDELEEIFEKGIRNFVIDNKVDLERILRVIEGVNLKSSLVIESPTRFHSPSQPQTLIARDDFENKINSERKFIKINLSLRMKFREHRIGSGKYFVYGMGSEKINKLIKKIRENKLIDKLGVHIHRKSQNTSEWDIKTEIEDSLKESLELIDFVNFGGGLPTKYRSYTMRVLDYIFEKILEAKKFLERYGIDSYIEPGRFLASPCVKLETEIIQLYDRNIVINTTIYNCALDTVIGHHKMIVESELDDAEEGEYYLIKGNSPTRDDIFRYRVRLENPKVGDKIIFLNAGAYNYTTDFFGYNKLKTEVVESF